MAMMKYRPEDVAQWMNRWVDAPMRAVGQWLGQMPAVEVMERDEVLVARAEVPGVAPDRLEVIVKPSSLTIRGEVSEEDQGKTGEGFLSERRYGKFSRTISLPAEVIETEATARHRHGVIEITMPRKDKGETGRRVPIEPDAGTP